MDLLDLFAKVSINTGEYEQGLNKSVSAAKKASSLIKGAMGVAGAAFAAVTAATAAFTKGIVDGASEVAAYGDQIDKASQKLGLSAEAYQEWDAILQHSGSSAEALAQPMRTLRAAAESGKDAFDKLGLSQEAVASMSAEDLFAATITGLQNITDENERATLATELLGRGAQEMGALLNTSAEDTEAMRQRVHELGGVLSDDSVKAAAAFQDSLQDLQTAFSGLKRGLTAEFMPGITQVMNGLTEIFSGDPDSGIAMISEGIDNVLTTIVDGLPMFIDTGMAILDALLEALIDNLPKLLEMGGKMLGELIAGLLEAIPQLIMSIPAIISALINGLAAAWPAIKQAGLDIVNMIGEGIKSAVDAASKWGKDLIDNFIGGIKSKIGAVGDAVKSVANKIKDFIGFSEPEEGPLSNFHTFAPDMVDLFITGLEQNKSRLANAMNSAFAGPVLTAGTGNAAGTAAGIGAEAEPRVIEITLVNEIDGAVLARKTFRQFVDEGNRRGTPITEGGYGHEAFSY